MVADAELVSHTTGCALGARCNRYPWFLCCATRLRLMTALGLIAQPEAIEVDYLPEEGWIHFFDRPWGPRAPAASAGGVRLIGWSE